MSARSRRRATRTGRNWKVDAHVERRADGAATLRVEARDAGGVPLSGLKFRGRLERPTDKRADRPVGAGRSRRRRLPRQRRRVAPGQWDLVLEGDAGGTAACSCRATASS